MTWSKLDDRFWSDPKIIAAGNAAAGAFCRMLSYCGAHLTDGEIPAGIVAFIAPGEELEELEQAGLVDVVDGGDVRIPDFLDFNPSREKVLEERAAAAERKRKSREKSRRRSERESHRDDAATSDRDFAGTNGVRSPSPTRPDPTRPETTTTTPPTPPLAGGSKRSS